MTTAVSIGVHAHELGWSNRTARHSLDAAVSLIERLAEVLPGCRVFVTGDGSLHAESLELRDDVLDELRARRELLERWTEPPS